MVIVEKVRCEKCKSSQVRTRLTTKDRICNTCGHISLIEKPVEENAFKGLLEGSI